MSDTNQNERSRKKKKICIVLMRETHHFTGTHKSYQFVFLFVSLVYSLSYQTYVSSVCVYILYTCFSDAVACGED